MPSVQKIVRSDAERFSLRGPQAYFNADHLADELCAKHQVAAKDRHFVKLQADSIRNCLQQALEYRAAALTSTFSRPTLTYYALMSFALCEILFKRDGRFRLAKLREKHGHHGLEFSVHTPSSFRGNIGPEMLSAKPLSRGTFPVWLESASPSRLVGKFSRQEGSAQTSGPEILAASASTESLPKSFTLLDLAQTCPSVCVELSEMGIRPQLVRATVDLTHRVSQGQLTLNAIIHPAAADVLDAVLPRIKFDPRCVDLVAPKEFPSGGGFRLVYPDDADFVTVEFPRSFSLEANQALLATDDIPLNEFGIYYVTAYIAGMYARYYPEYWARALETGAQTFQLVDCIMSAALLRSPLLLLGELRDRCYVLE